MNKNVHVCFCNAVVFCTCKLSKNNLIHFNTFMFNTDSMYSVTHIFQLTHPQLQNLGLKESSEFPICNYSIVVMFICISL